MRRGVDDIALGSVEFLIGVLTRAELESGDAVLVGITLCNDLAVSVLDAEACFRERLACGDVLLGDFELACGGLVDKADARFVFYCDLVAVLGDLKVVVIVVLLEACGRFLFRRGRTRQQEGR